MRDAARALAAKIREHPRHVALAALAAGLGSEPLAPLAALVLLVAAVTSRLAPRALVAAALLLSAGSLVADARRAALAPEAVGPGAGRGATLRATLLETPRATRSGWRVLAQTGAARVLVRGPGAVPAGGVGEVVLVAGRLHGLGPRDGWLRAQRAGAILEARGLARTGDRRAGVRGAVDAVRARARRALTGVLPPAESALLLGMVLGDDALLTVADRDALRRAGLGHLVAASGANVALLAALAMGAGAVVGIGRRPRLLLVLALVAFYVPLAGAGPSIQRAGIMGAATIVAALASRPAARWYAVLLAAAGTLALDPGASGDPGWRLSFAAVAGIAALGPPVRAALVRRRVPRAGADAIAVTVAATVATAPVAAEAFGTVSLASLPANVLVAPVVAPITWLGMLAAVAGQVDPAAARPLTWLAGPLLGWVLGTGRTCASLPAAAITASPVPVAAACAAAAALVLSARARRAGTMLAPLAAAALVVVVALARAPGVAPPGAGVLRVTFLDIGQGDATLLQAGSHAVLVDAGPPGGPILERLRRAGVGALDAVVGTHAQADHIGAAARVLASRPVGLLLDGRDGVREPSGAAMALAARRRRTPSVAPVAGDALRLGGLRLRVLWPRGRPGPPGGDPNDRAIVALAEGGGVRVLLTADAESSVIGRLDVGRIDVLKVSHHGSADPALPALLARLQPRVAVIEVGAGNTYGHPHPLTLAALRAAGTRVLRTDRDGTVRIDARGGRLLVQPRA